MTIWHTFTRSQSSISTMAEVVTPTLAIHLVDFGTITDQRTANELFTRICASMTCVLNQTGVHLTRQLWLTSVMFFLTLRTSSITNSDEMPLWWRTTKICLTRAFQCQKAPSIPRMAKSSRTQTTRLSAIIRTKSIAKVQQAWSVWGKKIWAGKWISTSLLTHA